MEKLRAACLPGVGEGKDRMSGVMRNAVLVTPGLSAAGAIAFGGVVWRHGFPLGLMDLDKNGLVSPREMVRSLDLGVWPVEGDGNPCREVFQLKDGIPFGVFCQN